MSRILNCTPHDVILYAEDDVYYDRHSHTHKLKEGAEFIVCFQPSGYIARCNYTKKNPIYINGIPIVHVEFTDVTGLPADEEEGTYYIVSSLVAQAGRYEGRNDLLVPTHTVRDSLGRVAGCLALGRA